MTYEEKLNRETQKYNQGFKDAKQRLNNRINREAAERKFKPSERRSYDATLHLAQEMITTAHSGNNVKVQLIKNIDNDSKHYGDKTLLGYTNKHHHLLVMELPLNDEQYRAVKANANTWR